MNEVDQVSYEELERSRRVLSVEAEAIYYPATPYL